MAQKLKTQQNNAKRNRTDKIDELVEMGFPIKRARIAFEQTNDVAMAAELLAIDQEESEEYQEVLGEHQAD